MGLERLQKVMASAGVASRRDCEKLIAAGRVTINGRVVREVGMRVDLVNDTICVDGTLVEQPTERTYILVHKPVGVVSTVDDPQGRPTVIDLVQSSIRLFPVGRLDATSEGLLLLTNDGDMTHRLTHPRFEVEKEYRVLLDRTPTATDLQAWCEGIMLDEKRTAPAHVDLLDETEEGTWLRVTMREGRKRQIREVAQELGYTVQRLIRIREGDLHLGELEPGQWRYLHAEEVAALQAHTTAIASTSDLRPASPKRANLSRSNHAPRADNRSRRPHRNDDPRTRTRGNGTGDPNRYKSHHSRDNADRHTPKRKNGSQEQRYAEYQRYTHSNRSKRLNQRDAYRSYEAQNRREPSSLSPFRAPPAANDSRRERYNSGHTTADRNASRTGRQRSPNRRDDQRSRYRGPSRQDEDES